MRTYKEEKTKILILDKITCNKCGKEALAKDYESASLFHDIEIEFGYPSSRDGDIWNFDLCESCLEEIIKDFAIPVTQEADFIFK